jgi:hypothetical protein
MADTNKYVITEDNKTYSELHLTSDPSYSEILKGSKRRNVVVEDSFIGGGNEDCVDMVRGENIKFQNLTVEAHEKTRVFFTLKGGIKGLTFNDVVLYGKSKWCWDISLGDWTNYDVDKRPKVRDIVLENVRFGDSNKRVKVLCLWSEKPTVIGGRVDIWKVPTFMVKILFWYKRKFGKGHVSVPLEDWEK